MIHSRLDQWLAAATRDLCDDAKRRVRIEVEAHFDAAYEQVRAEGLSEEAAAAWALTALGNERWAGKHFKKQYLTKGDLERLKPLTHFWRNLVEGSLYLAFFIGIVSLILSLGAKSYGAWQDFWMGVCLAGALASAIDHLLVALLGRRQPLVVIGARMFLRPFGRSGPFTTLIWGQSFAGQWETFRTPGVLNDPTIPILRAFSLAMVCAVTAIELTSGWTLINKLRRKYNREVLGL